MATASKLSLLAAVALMLAACSPEAEAPAEPAAPQKVGREAAIEAGNGTPEQFVRALYAAYDHPPAEPVAPGRDILIQRTLNAMIFYDWKNAKEANREPHLKNDPVCDCNGGKVVLKTVAITEGERNYADAAVTFTVDGTEKSQIVKLEKEGGRWKVLDIIKPGEKPLTEQLTAVLS